MLTLSVILCDLFGAICLLLNVFIIVTLIRNRHRMLTNVFYVIVLHCALVDLIRGFCLIAWGMPYLLMNNMPTMHDRLLALKICYGFILRTIRQFHSVDVKGGQFRSDESQRFSASQYRTKKMKEAERSESVNRRDSTQTAKTDPNNRSSTNRRWRKHLMSRHKYLIVIGSVLFVDILFLFPYSGIQMVAFLHLNNVLTTSHLSTLIRWGLQILIGVHSVCQPLCYFRMTEFRRLACCQQKFQRRQSRSCSQLHRSGACTVRNGNHSFKLFSLSGGTKEILKEEDELAVTRSMGDSPKPDDPLIRQGKGMKRKIALQNSFVSSFKFKTLDPNVWRRSNSIRFRAYSSSSGQVSSSYYQFIHISTL
ncbi:unnamed protein product [Anisakis simplex]|uniref:G_PROTEIN_RECEP_F1_2 domain-containing protein n=1 Tax=Anisakis simplex TaxID=6269 RepID=A0A0M3K6Z8_ANISI|nr:unnamed protein product [Anisakis simplex]